jgi:hypothetical protein
MDGRQCTLDFHTPTSATNGSLAGMNARRPNERTENGENDVWRRYS